VDLVKLSEILTNLIWISVIFISLETLTIGIVSGWNQVISFYMDSIAYQISIFIFLTFIAMLFTRYDKHVIEIHPNVVKDKNTNILSCFYRVKITDMINLNSFAAIYSLVPLSLLILPNDATLIVALYGKKRQEIAHRKKELTKYLSMAFKDVEELRDETLKEYIHKIWKNDVKTNSYISVCSNDIEEFEELIEAIREMNKTEKYHRWILSFDQSNDKQTEKAAIF
jgi:hypothetical protein